MADFKTTQVASLDVKGTRLDGTKANGTPGIYDAEYPVATEVANDRVLIGYFPAGAWIVPHGSRIGFETAATATGQLFGLDSAGVEVPLSFAAVASIAAGAGAGPPGFPKEIPPGPLGNYPVYWKHTSYTGAPPAGTPLKFSIAYKISH